MFYIQLAITMLIFVTLPIWKKVKENKGTEEIRQETISIGKALSIPKFKPTLTVFFASVALEAICLVWSCTYLVETKGVTEEKGAECVTFYFLGMTVGRFLSGILSTKLSPKQIIIIGECITFIAVTLLMLPLSLTVSVVGLFLIGLGNGPLFPNMTHLAPVHFGEKLSQATIGIQMAVSSFSVLVSPIIFGFLAENIGTHLFPPSLMAMVIVTVLSTALLFRKRNIR
jgi:fucose permease